MSHYKIVERLGKGWMGVVCKAQDAKLDREVALKLLPANTIASKEERIRFEQEAKPAAKLCHPNIAHIYEINEHDDQSFIIMENVDGETLSGKIEQRPLRIKDEALGAGRHDVVFEVVAASYTLSLFRRDLKIGPSIHCARRILCECEIFLVFAGECRFIWKYSYGFLPRPVGA